MVPVKLFSCTDKLRQVWVRLTIIFIFGVFFPLKISFVISDRMFFSKVSFTSISLIWIDSHSYKGSQGWSRTRAMTWSWKDLTVGRLKLTYTRGILLSSIPSTNNFIVDLWFPEELIEELFTVYNRRSFSSSSLKMKDTLYHSFPCCWCPVHLSTAFNDRLRRTMDSFSKTLVRYHNQSTSNLTPS